MNPLIQQPGSCGLTEGSPFQEIDMVEVCRKPAEVYREMARAEAALGEAEQRLEEMLQNNATPLATIMRFRMQLNEMRSYLRGLHFLAGKAESIFDRWRPDSD